MVKTDLHKGERVRGRRGRRWTEDEKTWDSSKVKCFTMSSNLPTATGKHKKAARRQGEAPPFWTINEKGDIHPGWFCPQITFTSSTFPLTVKNPPTMQETWVWSLDREDPLEEEIVIYFSYFCLENSMDRGVWQATVHGVAKSWTQLSNFTSSTLWWISGLQLQTI